MSGIKKCRVCGSENIEQFFDLGMQPFANALLDNREQFESEKKFPLSLSFCHDCSLVQLDYTPDPKELFENYFWVTSTSDVAKKYASAFCESALKKHDTEGYILEIASNDGTFLEPFKDRGRTVLGIDPAKNICQIANDKGINTKNDFFSYEVADSTVK